MELIHDENQIKKFVNILPILKRNEVYNISMLSRFKYVDNGGRRERLNNKIVKSSPNISMSYLNAIKTMEGKYFLKSGEQAPDETIVVYANITPSCLVQVLQNFHMYITNMLFNFYKNNETNSDFNNFDNNLMSYFNKNKVSKSLIDIDFDVPLEGYDIVQDFILKMKRKEVVYYTIKTKNGFHVILVKESIRFNYIIDVEKANADAKNRFGEDHIEVVLNQGGNIPIPGTIQAVFNVHFIDDLCCF